MVLRQEAANSLTQATDHAMLLAGDDLAALLGGLQHQLLIQRLDGGHIDDPGVDALSCQRLTGLDRLIDHQAVGDDGDIVAVTHHFALTDLELEALLMEHRHSQTTHPQIHRALILVSRDGGSLRLHTVGGADHHHAGDGAHQGEILTALMGSAVLAHGHTAVGSAHFDVQGGIADGVADLLISTTGGEHGEGRSEGSEAAGSQTRRHAHHIRFSDAAVEVPVREFLGEHTGLGRTGQIRIQHDDIIMGLTQSHQALAIPVTGGHFLHICHITCPPIQPASPSIRSWPAHTGRRWAPHHASRPDPP